MAEYDLTPLIAPHLDKRLVLKLLGLLCETNVYPEEDILKAEMDVLLQTDWYGGIFAAYKALHHVTDIDDLPQDLRQRAFEFDLRLEALHGTSHDLIRFFEGDWTQLGFTEDKQRNLQLLNDAKQIGPEEVEAFYQFFKVLFEIDPEFGHFIAPNLDMYRDHLCTDNERSFSALWIIFAARIFMGIWELKLKEFNRLKEVIDSENTFLSPEDQVKYRIRLMHWSLFIFLDHDNGVQVMIDNFFNQDKYLSAIISYAPHLLRYLAAAFVIAVERRNPDEFNNFIKLIHQQHVHCFFDDPITNLLLCVYVDHDFDAAQQLMKESEKVILSDPFLSKGSRKPNSWTLDIRAEFLKNVRLCIAENYSNVHPGTSGVLVHADKPESSGLGHDDDEVKELLHLET